ncbi:MAG TPA: hypothetical protein PLP73_04390, partial [Candidatus Absconditabacterales bacterium]|nr:hypothetical protein [Candidatus Absconditabacterales bacterium]
RKQTIFNYLKTYNNAKSEQSTKPNGEYNKSTVIMNKNSNDKTTEKFCGSLKSARTGYYDK